MKTHSVFDMWRSFLGIKKKKRRIYPAEQVATYDAELSCGNCGEEFVFAIPRRTTVEDYTEQTKCPTCETKNLGTYNSRTYY